MEERPTWPARMRRLSFEGVLIDAGAQAALRLVIGRLVRSAGEHLAQGAAPSRDDHQIVIAGDALNVGRIHRRDDQFAAALLIVLHQSRQVQAVVDDRRGAVKVPAEAQRFGGPKDAVVMTGVAVLGGTPMMHVQRALALQRVVVMGDRVEQSPRCDLITGLVGVDRDRDVVLLQEQSQMQSGHAGPDDPNSSGSGERPGSRSLSRAPANGAPESRA
jgi:hypothetical protein